MDKEQTKIRDIMHVIKARKWNWAGHIARLQDHIWTSQVTEWGPMDGSRTTDRLWKRRRDEIDDLWRSVTWKRNAQDRLSLKSKAEALIQQWISNDLI